MSKIYILLSYHDQTGETIFLPNRRVPFVISDDAPLEVAARWLARMKIKTSTKPKVRELAGQTVVHYKLQPQKKSNWVNIADVLIQKTYSKETKELIQALQVTLQH